MDILTRTQPFQNTIMFEKVSVGKADQYAFLHTSQINATASKSIIRKKSNFRLDFSVFDKSDIEVPYIIDKSKTKSDYNNFFVPDTIDNESDSLFASDSTFADDSVEVEPQYLQDTLYIDDDFSVAMDTIIFYPESLDSTARIKNFHTKRKESVTIDVYEKKPSRFFANPNNKKLEYTIDSSGQFVEVKEFIGKEETKVRMKMPFKDYIESKLRANRKRMWDKQAYEYELKDFGNVELSQLISDITDFEIPLPSVGVLSIFGEPKISLKIGGAVDIHAAWRNETTEGITASRLGNTRNEPDFKQQVQINVSGTIGDKLSILADWNTERDFEYENQLKIKYTGYEDEIIQSVEAGNVSLSTSGLVGGSEALFGIKANMILGPLNLTTLVSQKKGEVKEKELSGGSTSQEYQVRAYDYATNHFFVHEDYTENNIFTDYYGNPTPKINFQYYIKQIQVWKSINQIQPDPDERKAIAILDLDPIDRGEIYSDDIRNKEDEEGQIALGRFVLLQEGIDYDLHPNTGYITFRTSIQDQEIIAVAFQQEGPTNATTDDNFYGEFVLGDQTAEVDTSDYLVLKMVKPKNLGPQHEKAWKLMLKNIYPIGTRNVNEDGFEFDLKYEVDGGEPQNSLGSKRLLELFNLDRFGENGTGSPDGKFDFLQGITINKATGEIIFPVLQPFGDDLPLDDNKYKYEAIYTMSKTLAKNEKASDKWILSGQSSGSSSSTYQLGFSIVENSVKVILDGRELTPGVDYAVDYNIGQLTIRNDAALAPGANLKITYEENDLFQLASKTLFGLRGFVDFSKETKLGFSFLTLSQQTLSDKVRIGEEPLSNSIFGIDFSTKQDLPFLTKLLDNVISTKEMSTWTLNGEMAYMSPDPNTKKSNIQSDQGRSIAYIDDFEGSKRIIPIGINYGAWKDLSPPEELPNLPGMKKQESINYKGKAWWFNILPSDVEVKEIWPERKVAQGDEQVTVLDFVFQPDESGPFNYVRDFTEPEKSWGGMMKLLSSTANNLIEENIEFIEFWMKVQEKSDSAKLYIDLGKISEDVIPNNKLDTEDRPPYNELIDDEAEDTGLDGIPDATERAEYGTEYADPSGDNFTHVLGQRVLDPDDYKSLNGTEGNSASTDLGRIPDTEDLNRNGSLDLQTSFFRYEISLDTLKENNPYVVGGGNNDSWYLFRIPLAEFTTAVGNPSFTNVEMVRMFVTNTDQRFHVRMTDFNLIGNQWRKVIEDDSTLSVSVVNLEDNPSYVLPPGVERERDRSRPDQDIEKNEQSLNMILTELPQDSLREAVKYLYKPLDVFNYSEMKLFIHSDENTDPGSVSYFVNDTMYAADVYFRFGSDDNNYYEYRQPVQFDPSNEGWTEISIAFDELTALKQTRDENQDSTKLPVSGRPGHFFVLKGQPSLTQIKFLKIGIVNVGDQGPISGEVWVNELRVVGADDTPGWAYTASTNLKLADLMSINFNIRQTDPYFHKLNQRFGSRVENTSWGVSTNLNVLKLLPFNLPGSSLSINYSRTESMSSPLYMPGTDVKVDEARKLLREKMIREGATEEEANLASENLKTETETLSISNTFSISGIKLVVPVDHWLIEKTINSLSYGFNYNNSFQRNPTTEMSRSWVWNANVGYSLALDYSFQPKNIPYVGSIFEFLDDYSEYTINPLPTTIGWGISYSRRYSYTKSRERNNVPSQESISRNFSASRNLRLSWPLTANGLLNITADYDANANSTLNDLELDEFGRPRSDAEIFNDILNGNFFGKDLNYTQSINLRLSPKLPSLMNLDKYFTLSFGYRVNYNWNNNPAQQEIGRSAGISSSTTASMQIRLKSMLEPWFMESDDDKNSNNQDGGRRRRDFDQPTDDENSDTENEDTAEVQDSTSGSGDGGSPFALLGNAFSVIKMVTKALLVDYESISFNFSNNVSVAAGGLYGTGTGFANFWLPTHSDNAGPNRMFLLGFDHDPGRRVLSNGASFTDTYSEKNQLGWKTSRPLWEGASVSLDWKVGWSMNKSTTFSIENDAIIIQNSTSSGSINKSFMALPPILFFEDGIKKTHERYVNGDPLNEEDQGGNLSEAFLKGFEVFPVLSSIGFLEDFMTYIPRPNWNISWSGLEKLPLISSVAKSVSLNHNYTSDYNEGWKVTPDGNKVVQSQRISYAFSPLIGLTIGFPEIWGGRLNGSVKYSTRATYDLGVTTKNITRNSSEDIGFTLNFSKSGFEIPLFGVSLKNDIEISLTYSQGSNSTYLFDMNNYIEEGTPQNGMATTTIEPRVKYVLSSKVTMSLFYKRVQTEPEGASRNQPTTRNEAGLDIRISIN